MNRGLLLVLFLVAFALPALGKGRPGKVTLKDGRSYEGEIEESFGEVVVRLKHGELTFRPDQVDKIVYESRKKRKKRKKKKKEKKPIPRDWKGLQREPSVDGLATFLAHNPSSPDKDAAKTLLVETLRAHTLSRHKWFGELLGAARMAKDRIRLDVRNQKGMDYGQRFTYAEFVGKQVKAGLAKLGFECVEKALGAPTLLIKVKATQNAKLGYKNESKPWLPGIPAHAVTITIHRPGSDVWRFEAAVKSPRSVRHDKRFGVSEYDVRNATEPAIESKLRFSFFAWSILSKGSGK